MSFFKRIINALQRSRQKEALNYLETMSERQLIDCGFSPMLVSQGLQAWPWRIDSITPDPAILASLSTEQLSIDQLNRYSDVELADLGLRRGMIRDAVHNWRPGVDAIEINKLETNKAA